MIQRFEMMAWQEHLLPLRMAPESQPSYLLSLSLSLSHLELGTPFLLLPSLSCCLMHRAITITCFIILSISCPHRVTYTYTLGISPIMLHFHLHLL